MADGRAVYYALLGGAVLLGVAGQVLLKQAASTMGISPMQMITNRYFFIAVAVYGVSVVLYTLSLKALPLQIAFPAVSFSYVAVSYASHWLWGTPFGVREIFALLLITAGVLVLAWSR